MLLHVCHFLHHLPTFWQFIDYQDTRAYILDPRIQEFYRLGIHDLFFRNQNIQKIMPSTHMNWAVLQDPSFVYGARKIVFGVLNITAIDSA